MSSEKKDNLKNVVQSRIKGLGLDALFHQVDVTRKDNESSGPAQQPPGDERDLLARLKKGYLLHAPSGIREHCQAVWEHAILSKPQAVAALAFGPSAVKLLEIRSVDGRDVLSRATLIPVPHIVRSSHEKLEEFLVKTAQNSLNPSSLKRSAVTTILTKEKVIIKFFSLPTKDKAEVKKMLEFEAEHHLPFPLDEMEYDYHILEQDEAKTHLLLAAARKEDIAHLLDLFNQSGIQVDKIRVSSLALFNAGLPTLPRTGLSVQTNIGSVTTDINIIANGKIAYTRALPWGSRVLTETICASCHVDFDNAEKIKRENGILLLKDKGNDIEKQVSGLAQEWADNLVKEMNRTVQHFQLQQGLDAMDRVVLSGGGSKLKNLNEYLREKLQIKTIHLKQPKDLNGTAEAQDFNKYFPEFNILLGSIRTKQAAASIDLDLLPLRIKRSRLHKQQRTRQLALGAIAAFALAVLVLLPSGLVGLRGMMIKRLDKKISSIERRARIAQNFNEKLQTVQNYISVKQSCMEILREISMIVSYDIIIKSFSFNKNDAVILVGEAESHASAVNLSRSFRDSSLFANAKLKHTRKKDRLKENVDFEIICQLHDNGGIK